MRPIAALLLLGSLLAACSPEGARPTYPFFFYLRQAELPSLVIQPAPESSLSSSEYPLRAPTDCAFWSLTPAPAGLFAAIEWQCSFGPTVQVIDTGTGKAYALLDEPGLDTRFLAWTPDGTELYLKTGTLSNPQVIRVDVESRHVIRVSIPANTYNLTVAPNGKTIAYAFTDGIGLGSEVWGADLNAVYKQKALADPENIVGLMRYSPDGKHVAAMRLPDTQADLPPAELWLTDSDGKNLRLAGKADGGRGMPPVWSPDSRLIAFLGRDRPEDPSSVNLSIYDTTTLRVSAIPISPVTAPVWSPDGARLYFTVGIDDKMEIWFYEMSSGKTQKLLTGACCPGWLH